MKSKTVFLITALLLIASAFLTGCASTENGSEGLSLMQAIEHSAGRIAEELPPNSRVAIIAFESESRGLSDHIMAELGIAFFERGIGVVERQNLEQVYRELNLQISGYPSEESALSVGRFLGAQFVVTGALVNQGDSYRLRINAIDVERATRAAVTGSTVRNDREMQRLLAAL